MLTKIKFFKSSRCFLIQFFFIFLIFSGFGFSFKVSEPEPVLIGVEKKLKAKINYFEDSINPQILNQMDFFSSTDLEKYSKIGASEDLAGLWTGTYSLNRDAIFWTNSNLDIEKVFKLIDFRHYNVYLKFNMFNIKKMEIGQEGVNYNSIDVETPNDKQINYWARAKSSNWLEIVRGKVLRMNDNELFMIFQTTVYDRRIPIYAFNGELVLKRKRMRSRL